MNSFTLLAILYSNIAYCDKTGWNYIRNVYLSPELCTVIHACILLILLSVVASAH